MKKDLSIFEEDKLYFLGNDERTLINECIISEIPSSVYFIKKIVNGKIFLVYFLLETDTSSHITHFIFQYTHTLYYIISPSLQNNQLFLFFLNNKNNSNIYG